MSEPRDQREIGFPPIRDMTLRDWFAGQAMAGMRPDQYDPSESVSWAYEIADEMLKHRD